MLKDYKIPNDTSDGFNKIMNSEEWKFFEKQTSMTYDKNK